MRVFVTGATGHIGFRVATALRRRGHHVLGLTRSDAGAARLARHEIHSVKGTLQDPGTWKGAEDCSTLVIGKVGRIFTKRARWFRNNQRKTIPLSLDISTKLSSSTNGANVVNTWFSRLMAAPTNAMLVTFASASKVISQSWSRRITARVAAIAAMESVTGAWLAPRLCRTAAKAAGTWGAGTKKRALREETG